MTTARREPWRSRVHADGEVAEYPQDSCDRPVTLCEMKTGRMVLGALAVMSVVAVTVLTFTAVATATPCPAGQVPVTAEGFCAPLDPLFPTTPPTAPANSDPVQGEPSPSATRPVITASEPRNQQPRNNEEGPGSAAAPTALTSSPAASDLGPSPTVPPSPAPSPSAGAQSVTSPTGSLPATAPDSGSTSGTTIPGPQTAQKSTVAVGGYFLVAAGALLLASCAVGLRRYCLAIGEGRAARPRQLVGSSAHEHNR